MQWEIDEAMTDSKSNQNTFRYFLACLSPMLTGHDGKSGKCQEKDSYSFAIADTAIFFIVARAYLEAPGLKITVLLLSLCLLSIDA